MSTNELKGINLIKNGNFETGNLDHWTIETKGVSAFWHNESWHAKMEAGYPKGLLFQTRFKAAGGGYTFCVETSAPESTAPENPEDPNSMPLIFFSITCWTRNETGNLFPEHILGVPDYLTRKTRKFSFSHFALKDTEEISFGVSTGYGGASDLAGPAYIDNVKFMLTGDGKGDGKDNDEGNNHHHHHHHHLTR